MVFRTQRTTWKPIFQVPPLKAGVTLPPLLVAARLAAFLMDRAITIPFTRFSFGLDPILSLHPLVGGVVHFALALFQIMLVLHYDLPRTLILRMLANTVFDSLFGLIPLAGPFVDATFKASQINYSLLEKTYLEHYCVSKKTKRRSATPEIIDVVAETS